MKSRREHPVDASRRAFLSGRLFSAATRPVARRATTPLGPLPPCIAVAPPQAASACVDCAAPCARACPTNLVRLHPDNHERAGIPYLSFETGGCDFCGDCVTACPVEIDGEQPLRLGVAELKPKSCLAFDGIVCMACRFVCDAEALVFDPRGRPSVTPLSCNGCGACVGSCPASALTVPAHPLLNEVRQ